MSGAHRSTIPRLVLQATAARVASMAPSIRRPTGAPRSNSGSAETIALVRQLYDPLLRASYDDSHVRLADLDQLADDDVLPVRAPALDALDLHAEEGQTLGELLRGELDVDVVAQPGQRHPHRNCSRKRRSFSRNRRRSVMPCLSILMRSGPIPNAKPW